MGLRCTLLGHAWSDPQIEREREESDAEVVTTVREYKTCDRCGSRSVVSENVEVTAQESVARQDDADDASGPVIEDAETGERTVVDRDAGSDRTDTSDDDGAVILDEETGGSDDRAYGEWPEADDAAPDREEEPDPWPDHETEGSVRYDPDADAGDAAGSGTEPDTEGATGSGPDAERLDDAEPEGTETEDPADRVTVADGEEDEVELVGSGPDGADATEPGPSDAGSGGSTGGNSTAGRDDATGSADTVDPADVLSEAAADQQSGSDPVDPTMTADVETEVYCPECGFVGEDASPSLRGGDSCPNCRRAYLEEREV